MKTQAELQPVTKFSGRCLEFDFPSLHIGVAEYEEGPTGATVFWFPDKAVGAVDVRGGAPGSYNLDWLRLGYEFPNLDAIAISGGSWYGLGTGAGVAAALKERGHRSGHWANLANVAGAIIYDYGTRRLTSYHPDEPLGRAAFETARPGRFLQGARGAGRHTMQGSYFGLWLHSGQGGAFRQVGRTKIAAFTVVNSVGVIVDRENNIACADRSLPTGERKISDLLGQVPDRIHSQAGSIMGRRLSAQNPANTTISVVVTNQKMTYAQLNRLAVQVHTSMGRAIQPLATANDGDILFAVSTAEVENPDLHPTDLGVVASEVMWSAVLASVPDVKEPVDVSKPLPLEAVCGDFSFAPDLTMKVIVQGSDLEVTPIGERDIFDVPAGEAVRAHSRSANTFEVGRGFLERISFLKRGDEQVSLILNPGHWEQVGTRTSCRSDSSATIRGR
jgi:L-aminopeptidase/D-esterase-like protein